MVSPVRYSSCVIIGFFVIVFVTSITISGVKYFGGDESSTKIHEIFVKSEDYRFNNADTNAGLYDNENEFNRFIFTYIDGMTMGYGVEWAAAKKTGEGSFHHR